jgi:hypothetical protein
LGDLDCEIFWPPSQFPVDGRVKGVHDLAVLAAKMATQVPDPDLFAADARRLVKFQLVAPFVVL